ncbi:MAG: hypothetical protein RQ714_04805 [Nitrosomonas sp.]|nr:hypothetical protein [Nitrosomonas sp.]
MGILIGVVLLSAWNSRYYTRAIPENQNVKQDQTPIKNIDAAYNGQVAGSKETFFMKKYNIVMKYELSGAHGKKRLMTAAVICRRRSC